MQHVTRAATPFTNFITMSNNQPCIVEIQFTFLHYLNAVIIRSFDIFVTLNANIQMVIQTWPHKTTTEMWLLYSLSWISWRWDRQAVPKRRQPAATYSP